MKRPTANSVRRARIVLALDVGSFKEARYFVDMLYPTIKMFKVGLQLFTLCGGRIIEYINNRGGEVFLDLKLFDIPNTVAHAVRAATQLRIKMLTVHISGGEAMLQAALDAARDEARRSKTKRPLLIGVTVLTSEYTHAQRVLILAEKGIQAGLDGVVCSVREAGLIRKKLGTDFVIVTPGIRPRGAQVGDQKRVATAREAVRAGSTFLVVGRPLLQASDPRRALQELWR